MWSRRTAKTLPMYNLAQRTFKAKEKSACLITVIAFCRFAHSKDCCRWMRWSSGGWWGEIILFLYMMVTELVELNWSETEREREREMWIPNWATTHDWLLSSPPSTIFQRGKSLNFILSRAKNNTRREPFNFWLLDSLNGTSIVGARVA